MRVSMDLPKMLIQFLLSFLLVVANSEALECVSRNYNLSSTVCVCDSDQCDTLPRPERLKESQFYVYTSNKAGLRFEKEIGTFLDTDNPNNKVLIHPDEKYQTVLGFGGAFTDSTGLNIASLGEEVQKKLLRSYFSEDGIEYSLCRVPIGGTDFSTHGYSYNDGDVDIELNNFALAEEDYKYKIPYIRQAYNLTNSDLQLFASAWTAPKWMKTNGEYAGLGYLLDDMYQTWAEYFVKFLDSYKEEGVEFWGITTGNEPNNVLVPGIQINSVGWTASTQATWILNNLGPTIRNSGHSDINVMILDDQRLFLPRFVDSVLENNITRDYIDGIAVHWYTDPLIPAKTLTETHEHFPEKFILYSEASQDIHIGTGPVLLGSWESGEYYSSDIIEDMQNWVGGWVDWNMVLDLDGGPTYISNFLDAPIIVNATAGEFYKQPMFYHLGHFSKFIPRGSVRINSTPNLGSNVQIIAFQRPDNGTAIVLLNLEDEVVPVSITDVSRGTAEVELSERSITTVLYW